MAYIPEGLFMMGFNIENDQDWGDVDEEPVHEVHLDAFYIDRYEVTSEIFSRFLNQHPDDDRVTYRRQFKSLGFQVLEPVHSMEQGRSPYGVHHMAGNVWEWVADWYQDSYYDDSPQKNPSGPETGTGKVLRGGNWYFKAYYMRTTYRFNTHARAGKIWQGFRCARDAVP